MNGSTGLNRGMKFDGEKLRADLLLDMPHALDEVIDVLTQGAVKYAPGNWAHVDDAERRYKAASMRHELALALHGPHDDETGCHHLAHKICCDLFRLELALRGDQ
ncbi:dATP/dGTP diphosphohydrolase domain-containing protein [Vreelandella venusta]|uniref:dATP/dGTP diphosphohydrolase domain-containing protein n=1 Tax=Vreelandella venusta TaxID=44935 RepID=UPI00197D0D52|nr:dATP/dGTP diphosphohydrolase domain-containing protein [Halomonas venusta]